jgi:hypothetical protein
MWESAILMTLAPVAIRCCPHWGRGQVTGAAAPRGELDGDRSTPILQQMRREIWAADACAKHSRDPSLSVALTDRRLSEKW